MRAAAVVAVIVLLCGIFALGWFGRGWKAEVRDAERRAATAEERDGIKGDVENLDEDAAVGRLTGGR